ncbi:MAG: hypothetical protein JXO51_01400 [Candidatus Aminicenantes bacterium]|nr:hypothetical protein [Candidatus Aminicenantes bacterium]
MVRRSGVRGGVAFLCLGIALVLGRPLRGDEIRSAADPSFGADAAALWKKALAIYEKNRDWYPRKVTVVSEVLNRRHEPYSVTELNFALRLDDQGRLHTKLTRSMKNGKDTTGEMSKKVEIRSTPEGMDPDKEDSYSVSISDSPFDPEKQKLVSWRASAERQALFGHACRRFDFSFRTRILRKGEAEELTWTGMAWLDEVSGIPVKMEFTLEPLPSHIRSFWTIYLYDTRHPDKWVVKQVTIRGHGGFLFIIKRFRSTTTFADYRLPPGRAEED